MDKVFVVYSFDIADEIIFKKIKNLLEEKYTLIHNTKRSDISYSRKPLEFRFGEIFLKDLNKKAEIFMKIYDFGVISLLFEISYNNLDSQIIKDIKYRVTEEEYLLSEARRVVSEVVDVISIGIKENIYDITNFKDWEEYIIVEIHNEKSDFNNKELSSIFYESTKGRSLNNKEYYYYDSKALINFDLAIFIGDEDFFDCINIAEFANVYLLELRYYDFVLDESIDKIESLLEEIKTDKWVGFGRKFVKKVNKLNSLIFKISVDLLRNIDKVKNGLKFLGDLEINYIYQGLVKQLQLEIWKESIEMKLEYLHNLSEFLGQDIKEERMDRMESMMLIMEILMVLLWIWEIVLLFLE